MPTSPAKSAKSSSSSAPRSILGAAKKPKSAAGALKIKKPAARSKSVKPGVFYPKIYHILALEAFADLLPNLPERQSSKFFDDIGDFMTVAIYLSPPSPKRSTYKDPIPRSTYARKFLETLHADLIAAGSKSEKNETEVIRSIRSFVSSPNGNFGERFAALADPENGVIRATFSNVITKADTCDLCAAFMLRVIKELAFFGAVSVAYNGRPAVSAQNILIACLTTRMPQICVDAARMVLAGYNADVVRRLEEKAAKCRQAAEEAAERAIEEAVEEAAEEAAADEEDADAEEAADEEDAEEDADADADADEEADD